MKPIWLIVIGIILIVGGVGGTLVSVMGIFNGPLENYEEWDKTISDVGFAPFAMPASVLDEFAPILEEEFAVEAESNKTPAASETATEPSMDEHSNEADIDSSPIPTRQRPKVIPTRMIIPSIQLDAEIIPAKPKNIQIGGETYEQWQAPNKFAVGWHTTSAVLGQTGNSVFNGHHNIDGRVFENLYKVEPGDIIHIIGGDLQFEYMIANVMILPERNVDFETRLENAHWILPSNDERVTLVTCWPAWSNTHRLVVVAQPIGTPQPINKIPTSFGDNNY